MRPSLRFLEKLLNVRRPEWPRLVILSVMLFITNLGFIWGKITIEVGFLFDRGIEALPLILIFSGAISILAIALYTPFVDRLSNDTLLIIITGVTAAGIILSMTLLNLGLSWLAYPMLYLTSIIFLDTFNLHWETYVNGFYDTRSAKRLLPIVASADRIAAIIASLTIPLLNAFFTSDNSIIFIWLTTLILVALLAWLMPVLLKRRSLDKLTNPTPTPKVGQPKTPPSYMDNVREGYRYVIRSPFLRWMALSTFLTYTIFALLNYQGSDILLNELGSREAMSNFIGYLTGFGNALVLPFLLFGLSRVISRTGLGNASLIFPTGTLAVCAGLIFQRGVPGITAAAAAYANRTAFRSALRNPIDSLLYNAVPLRIKGRARAFISGFIIPIGSIVGGSLLLLAQSLSLPWFLFTITMILAMAYWGCAWIIRRQYSHALIDMLEEEDYTFIFAQDRGSQVVADRATLESLKERLRKSKTPELRLFMAQLIAEIGGSNAVPIFWDVIQAERDAAMRAALLNVLTAAELNHRTLRNLYASLLADPKGEVRHAAILGLEKLVGPDNEWFLGLTKEMLFDPDIEVRAQLLTMLARSDQFYQMEQAIESLNQFLGSHDPLRRASALHILGSVGDVRAIQNLLNYLTDPADQVRLAAALALETAVDHMLAQGAVPDSLPPLLLTRLKPLLRDPVERVRQATMNVLALFGDQETQQTLITALTDPSPQIRETAVTALVRGGKRIIPIIHPHLDAPQRNLRKMAAIVLSRVDRREYGSLITSHISANLLSIYQNYGIIDTLTRYTGYAGIVVLKSALAEQNQTLLAEIFYLLKAVHDDEDVEVIADSLRNRSPIVRANATEALESLTTPQTAQLVAPLFEPDRRPADLLRLSETIWEMKHPPVTDALRQLIVAPDSPWFRAITTFALGEMGAALVTNGDGHPPALADLPDNASRAAKLLAALESPPARPVRKARKKRRRPTADNLLGAIDSVAEDWSAGPSPAPKLEALEGEKTPEKDQPETKSKARRGQAAHLFDLMGDDENEAEEKAKEKEKKDRKQKETSPPVAAEPEVSPVPPDENKEQPQAEAKERRAARRAARRAKAANLFGLGSGDDDNNSKAKKDEESPPPAAAEPEISPTETRPTLPPPFSLAEIDELVEAAFADPQLDVRLAARVAKLMLTGFKITDMTAEEVVLLSTIEKIIFLKEVPFFNSMTVNQLEIVANICEEHLYQEDETIFHQNDSGGALYVVVYGKVGIEQEKRKGSFARLATLGAHTYFGEASLFDDSPRSASAIALQETLTLQVRREPLIALARQYPELSLELISVLSERLRAANDRIAELTRTRTRKLQKFYDTFE